MMNTRWLSGAFLGCLLGMGPALAHVTLETQEAKVGSYYKAVMRVPHGCDGAAMHTLRVQVPDGLVAVKPMPKAGWTLNTVVGPLDKPYESHGRTITEGVKEIVWSGGKLLNEHYDEFIFMTLITDQVPVDKMLYIPAVQECEKGRAAWIEIPAEGKTAKDYKEPAPGLMIRAGTKQGH